MSQLFVGIDIGKYHHDVTLLSAEGKTLRHFRIDNSAESLDYLMAAVAATEATAVVYGLEATGHYWLALYAALTRRGATVKVINPLQSDSLRNLYLRVSKTDAKDSFLIADLVRIGRYTETTVPEERIVALRDLSRLRVEFSVSLGSLKRRAHAVMDRIFPEWARLWSNPWGPTARAVLAAYPTPAALATADPAALQTLVTTTSRGRLGADTVAKLQAAAQRSFGVTYALDAATFSVQLLMAQMAFRDQQIAAIDEQLATLVPKHAPILTIPGIGPTLAAAILGEIGEITRFANGKKLKAYAGLDASVHQSGEFQGTRTRLSKRGSPYLRRALWLAAFMARTHDPGFRAYYDAKRAQGKHPNQALGAVAGKLCMVLWAILSRETPYNPAQLLPSALEQTS
jgi:transposase